MTIRLSFVRRLFYTVGMRHEALRKLAAPFLRSIQCRMTETFGLSVLDEKRLKSVIVSHIRGPDYVCFAFEDGTATPLYTSAPGKAFVAALPDKRRDALLKRVRFKRLTPHTITDRRGFESEIARIRKAGYATDLSEEIEGCHCGGVAVLDAKRMPVAALWVSGIDKRLPSKKLLASIRRLQAAARRIEKELENAAAQRTARPHRTPCVAAACAKMAAHPQDPIDYAALAKAAGVSYSTLRTAFRAETGTTLGQYHLGLRIAKACRLLRTGLAVTSVAERTGFCNQKHFSAIFKRKTGKSPLAYRMQAQPGNTRGTGVSAAG